MAKRAYLCEVLANCLASVTEHCSKFPGFRNRDGSGLTGQKDFQNYTNKWKTRGKSPALLLQKAEGPCVWVKSLQVFEQVIESPGWADPRVLSSFN